MPAISTVSVIFSQNESIQSVVSFPDTQEGNSLAEKAFAEKIHQIYPDTFSDDTISDLLDNGYFESDDSIHKLFLVHSSTLTEFKDS